MRAAAVVAVLGAVLTAAAFVRVVTEATGLDGFLASTGVVLFIGGWSTAQLLSD